MRYGFKHLTPHGGCSLCWCWVMRPKDSSNYLGVCCVRSDCSLGSCRLVSRTVLWDWLKNLNWLQSFRCSSYAVGLKSLLEHATAVQVRPLPRLLLPAFFLAALAVTAQDGSIAHDPLSWVSATSLTVITSFPRFPDFKAWLFSFNYSEWDRRWAINVT